MYERHFGLHKPPFRITPDPEFFFPGGNRGAVLEALVYAVARGEGIVKVVGEVGSGKTMLCRMLERELPDGCEIVYLANPSLTAQEILHAIGFELKLAIKPDDSKLKVLHELQHHLLARHAEDRRVIVFIEEAQAMPLESLEEIRMLSNLETSQEKLLQIVLFGQPELDDKLARHEIRQLRERITHRFDLAPFDRAEVREYVGARLRQSGYRGGALFTAGALRELARYSEGLLRRINVLADKALLAAFAAGATAVTPAHVRLAARDSEFARAGWRRRWPLALAGLLLALVCAGVLLWMLGATTEILPPDGAPSPAVSAPDAATPRLDPDSAVPGPPVVAAADPAATPAAREAAVPDARQALLPSVSPRTGLVGTEHLVPRLLEAPEAVPEVAVSASAE